MRIRWTNITVFLLFFGVSVLETFRSGDWIMAAFWMLIGLVFLLGDLIDRKR